jgi:hypothetical protein
MIQVIGFQAYPPEDPLPEYLDGLAALLNSGWKIETTYIAPAQMKGQSPALMFILSRNLQ